MGLLSLQDRRHGNPSSRGPIRSVQPVRPGNRWEVCAAAMTQCIMGNSPRWRLALSAVEGRQKQEALTFFQRRCDHTSGFYLLTCGETRWDRSVPLIPMLLLFMLFLFFTWDPKNVRSIPESRKKKVLCWPWRVTVLLPKYYWSQPAGTHAASLMTEELKGAEPAGGSCCALWPEPVFLPLHSNKDHTFEGCLICTHL